MAIPKQVIIKNGQLPDNPGVYFYYNSKGKLLYIGKATSLKKRVGSYFTHRRQGYGGQAKDHGQRIERLVSEIARIDYIETPTVIEALVLEANQIKKHKPPYNIRERDDKSFLYLVITNEDYPKPVLMRGLELERLGVNPFGRGEQPFASSSRVRKRFLRVFGPYTSGRNLRTALNLVRKIIPWSTCEPPSNAKGWTKPCFNYHIHRCPGVCIGAISKTEYRKIIRKLILFFEGKKSQILKQMVRDMKKASKELRYEDANIIKRQIFALEHIQDVALVTHDVEVEGRSPLRSGDLFLNIMGRIEGYDISNISGSSAVGSMVVFEEGEPVKSEYRKFKIKGVTAGPAFGRDPAGTKCERERLSTQDALPPSFDGAGAGVTPTLRGDVAMLEEIIRRRLARSTFRDAGTPKVRSVWPLPELMIIDGGIGQVNRVQSVLGEFGFDIPVVGIAKGFDRKQDRFVFDKQNLELGRVVQNNKDLFLRVRDEAHRFAVQYHRQVRSKKSIGK